jgi:hypothetical protein
MEREERALLFPVAAPSRSQGPNSTTDPVSDNLEVVVALDPLSSTAQRLSPFLAVLRDHLQLPFKLLLVPVLETSDFPLKSYYRFAAFPSPQQTSLLFQSLPTQHILTTRVDVPEPWNVQTKQALQVGGLPDQSVVT